MRLAIILLLCIPLDALAQTAPTLPASFGSTTTPTINGTTYTVSSCGTLQSNLNSAGADNASLNHAVNIDHTLSCTGPYFLPSRTGPGYVIVRTDAFASLPAEGTRVGPSDATNMPIIKFGTNGSVNAAFSSSTGANYYRLTGLDIRENTALSPNGNFIATGDAASVTNTGHIIIDRVLIRNTTAQGSTTYVNQGIIANADNGYIAIVDSYCSGVRNPGADTQCVLITSNPGPTLIQNNYLEAGGEVIMTGGGDPRAQAYMPADVSILRNHILHDTFYQSGSNTTSLLKTLLELKGVYRLLAEGNTFEYAWAGTLADTGHAFRLTERNNSGSAAYIGNTDITIRYNTVRHIGGWISMFSSDDGTGNGGHTSLGAARWKIHDNIVYDMGGSWDPSCVGSCGGVINWGAGGTAKSDSIQFIHNTVYNTAGGSNFITFCSTPTGDTGLVMKDNIFPFLNNGINGSLCTPGGHGAATFDYSYGTGALPTGYQFTNNGVVGLGASGQSVSTYQGSGGTTTRMLNNCWGTNGSKDSTTNLAYADFGFNNPGALDTSTFVMTSGPFRAGQTCQSTDAKDLGVDWTAFNAAQGGGDTTPPAAPTGVTVATKRIYHGNR